MINSIVKTASLLVFDFPVIAFSSVFRRNHLPQVVKRIITRMGPVYIKAAQVLSTRRDIFPDAYLKVFAELREAVPSMPDKALQRILLRAYPQGIDKYFRSFEKKSIAAGSVAQVHVAWLHDGTKVAVKILRPGIARDIENNMRPLMFFAYVGEKISSRMAAINVSGMLSEVRELLRKQASMSLEAENYRQFHAAYAKDENIRIPRLYEEASGPEVLVTAFVEAIHPDDYRKVNISPLKLARHLDRLLDNMLFLRGLVHADMHPGNFFWDEEGHLVLIDLGLAHTLSQDDRNHLMTFYYAVVDGYYSFAASYFMRYLAVPVSAKVQRDDNAAVTAAVTLLEKHYRESNGKPKFATLFSDLLVLLGRYRLKLYPGFTNIFLTLITVEGYLYALDPDFDMIDNARMKRIDEMEYANVPEEAVQIVLGEHGTYSTARFVDGETDPQVAYRERNQFVLRECLDAQPGRLLIDVGCGRGGLLLATREYGLRPLGITINRAEQSACSGKGLEVVRSAWEDFERAHGASYPLADYMTIVEVLSHLGSLHENRVGLVSERLRRLFSWLNERVAENGKVYLQEMVVSDVLLNDPAHEHEFERVTRLLPWVGFTVLEQILSHAAPYFDVIRCEDHTADIPPTYDFFLSRVVASRQRLIEILTPEIVEYIEGEINGYRTLALEGSIKLYRICLVKRAAQSWAA